MKVYTRVVNIYMEYVCHVYIFNFKVSLLNGICAEIWGLVMRTLYTYANIAHLETFIINVMPLILATSVLRLEFTPSSLFFILLHFFSFFTKRKEKARPHLA